MIIPQDEIVAREYEKAVADGEDREVKRSLLEGFLEDRVRKNLTLILNDFLRPLS